ncbi:ankyrin repeat-containing domain protein, partial [Mycena albidolilacea]
ASYYGHYEMVKFLLDNGANPDARGGTYTNPLQAASYYGHINIVKLLIDCSAEVNAQAVNHKGSALYLVFSAEHMEIVDLLLARGANINASGGSVQVASYRGNKAIVELLLKHNDDVNARGGQHGSALDTVWK